MCCLCPGTQRELACTLFKSWIFVSYSPLVLPVVSSSGFQNSLSGLTFPVLVSRARVPNVQPAPSFPRDLRVCDIPFCFGCPVEGAGPDWITSPPCHLSSRGFFLHVLGCGRTVLPIIMLFSERVVSYIVVVLVHLWDEVSSRSFYFASLLLPTLPLFCILMEHQ